MNHIDNKHIKKFIDGRLSETERAKTADEISKYNKTIEMKSSKMFNADKAWDSFSQRISEKDTATDRNRRSIVYRQLKYAASIILILGLSYISYYFLNTDKTVEFASLNGIKELTLPDGSAVTLNESSSISFSKTFKGNTRDIEFTGEAYFDVAKDPNKPFIIHANGAEIKVLGTEFNLSSNNGRTEVTVTVGKVKLTDVSDNENVLLTVGDRGEVFNGSVSKSKNLNKNFLSWKTKNLYFEQGVLLKEVMADLEKRDHVTIEFKDDSLALKPISKSVFTEKDSLEFILDLFGTSHGFIHTVSNNKIILSRKTD